MVFFYRVLFFATVKFAEKLQPWINGVLLPLLRSSKQPNSAVMRETVAP
jgi:prophage antirepressor-like protein